MKKLSLFIFPMIFFIFSHVVFADVIDLDVNNATHCRQQLLESQDPNPTVLAYFHDCPVAKNWMPIYEEAAKDHPERTFFRYDFQDAGKARTMCLQVVGAMYSPTVIMFHRYGEELKGLLINYRMFSGVGLWTEDDLMTFIKMNSAKLKNTDVPQ